jgi:hypothetical protein
MQSATRIFPVGYSLATAHLILAEDGICRTCERPTADTPGEDCLTVNQHPVPHTQPLTAGELREGDLIYRTARQDWADQPRTITRKPSVSTDHRTVTVTAAGNGEELFQLDYRETVLVKRPYSSTGTIETRIEDMRVGRRYVTCRPGYEGPVDCREEDHHRDARRSRRRWGGRPRAAGSGRTGR